MANSFFKRKNALLLAIASAVIATGTVVFLKNKNIPVEVADKRQKAINDSLELEAFYKREENKPYINPPLKGVDIPFTTFKVDVAKGGVLVLASGSKIGIPKNAFIDSLSKTLEGEVEIRCREFRDAIDFFVAGIPMTYDSAGTRYQFESAGMIEVKGYQNGKAIQMAPEKKLDIELVSNDAGTDHNLYQLQPKINNWSCLGKDKVVRSAAGTPKTTTSAPVIPAVPAVRLNPIEEQKTKAETQKKTTLATLPAPPDKPIQPEKANNAKYNFNIEVDPVEHPELAIYKGLLFQVGDENKNFNETAYKVIWDDALIKDGPNKGVNYLLTLTKGNKNYKLVVYPVFEGKDYEQAIANYQGKFKKYNTLLEQTKEEEKRIETAYLQKMAAIKKQEEIIRRQWEQEIQNEYKMLSKEEKIKRTFSISSFGIYNCDKGVAYPQGITCVAELTADNKKLICYDIFMADSARNIMYNYYKNPVMNFSYNPHSKNILWTVEKGILYWLKPEQFKSIEVVNGKATLPMNKVTEEFKSAEEIKAFFNL